MNESTAPNESTQALHAYQDYRDLPLPRSLERLAEKYRTCTDTIPPTRHLATLKEWSSKYHWQARIMAHEQRLADEAEEAIIKAELSQQAKMRQARLQMAARMHKIGLDALEANAKAGKIGAYAAVQLIHEANDMQRKDTGEDIQRLQLSGPGGGALVVRWLTPDEAEAQRLAAKQQKKLETEELR